MIWFVFASGWFAVAANGDGTAVVIRLFDPAVVKGYLVLLMAAFAVAMLREIGKLVARRWSRRLIVWQAAASLVLLAAGLILFSDSSIWNADFVEEWAAAGWLDASGGNYDTVSGIWTFVQERTPVFILIGFAIDLGMILWKWKAVGASAQAR